MTVPNLDPVEVVIRALIVDPSSEMPVVLLQVPGDEGVLPIWVGACEANAIAMAMEGITPPRPMTHDLLASVLAAVGHRLVSILIHTLEGSVFHASLHLIDGDGEPLEIDSRPSDAMALALRTGAQILVSRRVLESARIDQASTEDALKELLEKLRPEDLGEYEM